MKFSIKKLSSILRDNFKSIQIAYLFGSSANGEVKDGSDIDIAVLIDIEVLDKNPAIGIEIEIFVQDIFNVPVDAVILNKANSILKYQVLKTGSRLFDKDPKKRLALEVSFVKDYFDVLYYQQKRNNYGK